MVGAAVFSLLALPRLATPDRAAHRGAPRRDRLPGGAARRWRWATVVSDQFGPAIARVLLAPWLEATALGAALQARWVDLVTLLLGIAFTLPLAAWAARKAHFETLLGACRTTSHSPARPGSWCSSCCTSWATRSPAR